MAKPTVKSYSEQDKRDITPEMVEAGVLALSEYSSFFDVPADGVEKIYRAMEAARLDRTKNYVGGV